MDRTVARAHAMKLIYEWEMGGDGGEDTRLMLGVEPGERESEYMNRMFEGVVAEQEGLDEAIARHLRGWTIERLSKVDLAILRLAAYELSLGETPAGVVINEAVELANRYSADKASSFINGVLGALSREEEK